MSYSDRGRITLEMIEALKNQGLNKSEIAARFNITKQAVSYHKATYNGAKTPRELVLENFPWKVPEAMCQTSPYRRLRDHGEYMATQGKGMSDDKLKRLRAFYRKLRDEDVVVEFDPKIPPRVGVSNKGGFAFRPRTRSDGDLIIRVNKHTTLTTEGRLIWCLPTEGIPE